MRSIKVAIGEDHALLRDGLVSYLNTHNDISVIAEATNGIDLLEMIKRHKPDVIIVDLLMPGLAGTELVKEIRSLGEKRIIIFSSVDCDRVILNTLKSGAMSYVTKSAPREELIRSVRSTYKYQDYFCPFAHMKLKQVMRSACGVDPLQRDNFSDLEMRIIRMVCEEKTSNEIAGELNKSKKTIDRVRTQIFEKMKVKGSAGLVVYAITKLVMPWEIKDLTNTDWTNNIFKSH